MGRTRVIAVLCLAATCLSSRPPAYASEWGTIEKGDLSLPWPSIALYLSFDLAGGVYGSANLVQVAMGAKPDRHWRVGGWIFGGLHSLAGVGFLAASEHNGWERYLLGFGLGHLAWGLLTLGVTASASSMQDPPGPDATEPDGARVSAHPIVLSGARGEALGGIGVTLTGW